MILVFAGAGSSAAVDFSKQCHNLEGVIPRFMNHNTRVSNT